MQDSRGELTKVTYRSAVRALLLTPDHYVLLIQIREPTSGRLLWLTPGGGLDTGETPEMCLRREVREETSLTGFSLGPQVWKRHHTFTWAGAQINQREAFYLIHTDRFEPIMEANPDVNEAGFSLGFRWWPIDEIVLSEAMFSPRRLGF